MSSEHWHQHRRKFFASDQASDLHWNLSRVECSTYSIRHHSRDPLSLSIVICIWWVVENVLTEKTFRNECKSWSKWVAKELYSLKAEFQHIMLEHRRTVPNLLTIWLRIFIRIPFWFQARIKVFWFQVSLHSTLDINSNLNVPGLSLLSLIDCVPLRWRLDPKRFRYHNASVGIRRWIRRFRNRKMVTDVEKNDDGDVIGDGLYESFERNN